MFVSKMLRLFVFLFFFFGFFLQDLCYTALLNVKKHFMTMASNPELLFNKSKLVHIKGVTLCSYKY